MRGQVAAVAAVAVAILVAEAIPEAEVNLMVDISRVAISRALVRAATGAIPAVIKDKVIKGVTERLRHRLRFPKCIHSATVIANSSLMHSPSFIDATLLHLTVHGFPRWCFRFVATHHRFLHPHSRLIVFCGNFVCHKCDQSCVRVFFTLCVFYPFKKRTMLTMQPSSHLFEYTIALRTSRVNIECNSQTCPRAENCVRVKSK